MWMRARRSMREDHGREDRKDDASETSRHDILPIPDGSHVRLDLIMEYGGNEAAQPLQR
jgi:hypothetical protein